MENPNLRPKGQSSIDKTKLFGKNEILKWLKTNILNFDQDCWRTWTRLLAYLDQDLWRTWTRLLALAGPDVWHTWTRFLDQILTRIYTVYSSTGTEKYSVQFHRDGELIRNLLETY